MKEIGAAVDRAERQAVAIRRLGNDEVFLSLPIDEEDEGMIAASQITGKSPFGGRTLVRGWEGGEKGARLQIA